MASSSLFVFPQEGLDYALGVLPKGGTAPSTLYLGLFTTAWSTVQGYGLTNINITLGTGTYPVTELASATGYTTRKSIPASDWGLPSASTYTIGSNTINVRQVTTNAAGTTGPYVFTNGGSSAWSVTGMFIATSPTVGQASGAGTTVLWYAPWADQTAVSVAVGDSLTVTPTWQSAPYPA